VDPTEIKNRRRRRSAFKPLLLPVFDRARRKRAGKNLKKRRRRWGAFRDKNRLSARRLARHAPWCRAHRATSSWKPNLLLLSRPHISNYIIYEKTPREILITRVPLCAPLYLITIHTHMHFFNTSSGRRTRQHQNVDRRGYRARVLLRQGWKLVRAIVACELITQEATAIN
jgi:hypothetical protein